MEHRLEEMETRDALMYAKAMTENIAECAEEAAWRMLGLFVCSGLWVVAELGIFIDWFFAFWFPSDAEVAVDDGFLFDGLVISDVQDVWGLMAIPWRFAGCYLLWRSFVA
ncbi:hypothetical protein Ancab_007955 [Ancistrocladus abbreviatus]